jgi:hypothetical protein
VITLAFSLKRRRESSGLCMFFNDSHRTAGAAPLKMTAIGQADL